MSDGRFIGAPAEKDPLVNSSDGREFTIPKSQSTAASRDCPLSSSIAVAITASCPACGCCAGSPISTLGWVPAEGQLNIRASYVSGNLNFRNLRNVGITV